MSKRKLLRRTVLFLITLPFVLSSSFCFGQRAKPPLDKAKNADSSPLTKSFSLLCNSTTVVYADAVESKDKGGKVLGTGFAVRKDGLILTARHTIVGGNIQVGLPKDKAFQLFPAKIVGEDEINDMVLLKVDSNCIPVTFGPSPKIPGADAAIVGFMFGPTSDGRFFPSVSCGIVGSLTPPSQKNKEQLIQINLLIGPGSSGSPVFIPKSGVVYGMVVRQLLLGDATPLSAGLVVTSDTIQQFLHKFSPAIQETPAQTRTPKTNTVPKNSKPVK